MQFFDFVSPTEAAFDIKSKHLWRGNGYGCPDRNYTFPGQKHLDPKEEIYNEKILFTKSFIVFPESVDYDFTKPRSQISTSDYQHLICESLPPDVDNSEHSFVAIGVQKHISGNKCSAELLYIIRDSTEQFHAGDKFITNCEKAYSTGLQFFSGREIRYKKNNYEHTNIFLIELNYNLTEYIYYPGSYGDTWSDFMMPAHFPIGYITCPEVWRKPIDFIKEKFDRRSF